MNVIWSGFNPRLSSLFWDVLMTLKAPERTNGWQVLFPSAALQWSRLIFPHSASPALSRLHTLCAALQKLEQRSSTRSGLCTMDTQGCRIPTPTQ